MNQELLFDALRRRLFPSMTRSQVEGVVATLDAFARLAPRADRRWLAYMLATQYWETARAMQPVREFGRGRDRPYGAPSGRWRQIFFGRGDVQLTWEKNYAKADAELRRRGFLRGDENLVENADLALRPDIAAAIMVLGMCEGWFTGRKLADYFTDGAADWIGARAIVNGRDKAAQIAAYAKEFLTAIDAASDETRAERFSAVSEKRSSLNLSSMKGYRTYAAAGLTAIFGVLSSTDWIGFLADPKAGAVALGSAALMAALRTVTTTAPGKSA